jgi:hypothetical protein
MLSTRVLIQTCIMLGNGHTKLLGAFDTTFWKGLDLQ